MGRPEVNWVFGRPWQVSPAQREIAKSASAPASSRPGSKDLGCNRSVTVSANELCYIMLNDPPIDMEPPRSL